MKYKVSPEGYPILDQFSEEGFIDCFLQVTNRTDSDQHFGLVLRASYQGSPVGMNVRVRRDIRGGFDSATNLISAHISSNAVEFVRSGPDSDNLVTALAELYKLPSRPLRMIEHITFTGIALHEDGEVDMDQKPIKIKIFGYDGADDPSDKYSESFFNLDLANGFVYWNEKDQEYRSSLIRSLSILDGN